MLNDHSVVLFKRLLGSLLYFRATVFFLPYFFLNKKNHKKPVNVFYSISWSQREVKMDSSDL